MTFQEGHKWLKSCHRYNDVQKPLIMAWKTVSTMCTRKFYGKLFLPFVSFLTQWGDNIDKQWGVPEKWQKHLPPIAMLPQLCHNMGKSCTNVCKSNSCYKNYGKDADEKQVFFHCTGRLSFVKVDGF